MNENKMERMFNMWNDYLEVEMVSLGDGLWILRS